MNKKHKMIAGFAGVILFWLFIWQLISILVDNNVLLVGPFEVITALIRRLTDTSFWFGILYSSIKIWGGFLCGTVIGAVLAVASYKWVFVQKVLSVPMAFIKSAPVAAFVVLFLIWWSSDALSFIICTLIVLPQIYVNLLTGLHNTNNQLLELAQVYKLPVLDKYYYIYIPAINPYIESAIKISAGMAWKSAVAAEVIAVPTHSLGSELYMSKIYLDTAGVFVYTFVIIVLSVIFEKLIMTMWLAYCKRQPVCHGLKSRKDTIHPDSIEIRHLSKCYKENVVYANFDLVVNKGEPYRINTPSGTGKTTLFRMLLGLEEMDTGEIYPHSDLDYSVVFQEDRLCEDSSAIRNVALVCGDEKKAEEILLRLLDENELCKPVKELSGGQRRRVAVARACSVDAAVAFFDEPYSGLDEENVLKVRKMIEEYAVGKIVMIASHIDIH